MLSFMIIFVQLLCNVDGKLTFQCLATNVCIRLIIPPFSYELRSHRFCIFTNLLLSIYIYVTNLCVGLTGLIAAACGQLGNVMQIMQTSNHDAMPMPSTKGYTSNGSTLTYMAMTYPNGNGVKPANGSLNGTIYSNGNGVHV